MKISNPKPMLDAVAQQGDIVELNVQKDIIGGYKIYIHVNGECVCRVGMITRLVTNIDSEVTDAIAKKVNRQS